MDTTHYRFTLGKFECHVITDGTLVMPDPQSKKPFNPDDMGSGQVIDILSLFIRTGKHNVLIDTGCGLGLKPGAGQLVPNLESSGIKTTEVDTVILTHAHPDHIGANVDAAGKPVFANARYFIHRIEWDYWINRLNREPDDPTKKPNMLGAARRSLLPIRALYTQVEGPGDIVPGINYFLAPGHTPGGMVLVISSGKEKMLCIGDLIHHPKEFAQPDLYAQVDVVPEQAIRSRNKVFSDAVSEGTLIFGGHMPFPGLGYVQKKGAVFSWKPIKTAV
jgi:glyoxylase-like metal-dependent hydrolase (beta-lactamase superfamily II)